MVAYGEMKQVEWKAYYGVILSSSNASVMCGMKKLIGERRCKGSE